MPESNTPIGRGSGILDREGFEVQSEEAAVHGGELLKVGERDPLVDFVDRRGEEAELDHGTELLDEARVGRAAVGRERGRKPGHFANRLAQDGVERAGLGQEAVARGLEAELEIEAGVSERLPRLLAQQGLKRLRGMAVVVENVEYGLRLRRNDVGYG